MASDSELKNVSESLKVTLARAQRYGVTINWEHLAGSGLMQVLIIDPLMVCPECMEWSLADHCLWCEPEEFDGEGVA